MFYSVMVRIINKVKFIILFCITINLCVAQQVEYEWVKSFGGFAWDMGYAITTDNTRNIYLTGYIASDTAYFDNDTLFSNGSCDIYLAKFDSLGGLLWIRQAGGDWWDEGKTIALDDENNIYIAGKFVDTVMFENDTIISFSTDGYDVFLAKYDNDGNLLWTETGGGKLGDIPKAVGTDQSNNIYLAGWFQDTAYFDSDTIIATGEINMFLAKYNSSGELQWIKTAGTYVSVITLTIDNFNNIYVAGSFKNIANFNGISMTSSGSDDIFIAKYSGQGNILWVKKYGGNWVDQIVSMKYDNNSSIYVCGIFSTNVQLGSTALTSNGYSDILVAKCDTSGNILWANGYGGTYYDLGRSVDFDSENNIYLLGEYQSPEITIGDSLYHVQYQSDIFVAKFNNNGDFIWAKNATSDYSVVTYSLKVNDSDDVLFTGGLGETTTFGDTSITSRGSWDIFIAKLKQNITGDMPKINDELSFKVYPNPAVNYFIIERQNIFEKRSINIRIVDIYDRTIKEFSVAAPNVRIRVSTSGINSGIYYCYIYDGDKKLNVRKIVISK
ncbi:MAG: SBBP repeat-containing protein [Bacteroidia bacterium]|nr:SBBP repeat-containing protein [Bacteroidia bacterium]